MATVQRASMIQYPDGQVAIHNIRKKRLSIPVFGPNESYSATLVNSWWDGTPMDDSKADGNVYFKLKKLPSGADTGLSQYIGSYFKVNLPNDGELFLEKDTMAEMRDLNSTEILLLQMGYYQGVKLNGYYEANDTRYPIQYFIIDVGEDDGASCIDLGVIKLGHNFGSTIYSNHFGLRGDATTDNSVQIQRLVDYARNCTVRIERGVYRVVNQIDLPSQWQVILEGEGRLSRRGGDFSAGDGIVKINWEGSSEDSTAAFKYEGTTNFEGEFKNIFINNRSGAKDVDGIYFGHNYTVGEMDRVTINGFRNGLVLKRYFFYTKFTRCMFSNNINGVLAEPESGEEALANGATFDSCLFSLNDECGFKGTALGEIINFRDCYVEYNGQYGISVERCKVVNIEGGYIEFNGESTDFPIATKGTFRFSSGVPTTSRVPHQMVVNINKVFIFLRGENNVFMVSPIQEPSLGMRDVSINFIGNTLYGSQLVNGTFIRLSTTANASGVCLTMQGNSYFDSTMSPTNIRFSNASASLFKILNIQDDTLCRQVFPHLVNRGLSQENIVPITVGTGYNPNLNTNTVKSFDFPFLTSANGIIEFFRNTITTGLRRLHLYRGDGSDDLTIALDPSDGNITATTYSLATRSRQISVGGGSPEGNLSQTNGALYLRTEGVIAPYYKTGGSSMTGWKQLAFLEDVAGDATTTEKGLVNQSEAITDITTPDATDEATAIALANANKAKINEMLTKLRTAGIIVE